MRGLNESLAAARSLSGGMGRSYQREGGECEGPPFQFARMHRKRAQARILYRAARTAWAWATNSQTHLDDAPDLGVGHTWVKHGKQSSKARAENPPSVRQRGRQAHTPLFVCVSERECMRAEWSVSRIKGEPRIETSWTDISSQLPNRRPSCVAGRPLQVIRLELCKEPGHHGIQDRLEHARARPLDRGN
jgi:hypothetical protein